MIGKIIKFLAPVLGVILIGGGVWYGIQYWRYINSEEYQAIKYIKEITKKYAEDTYGGDTPEETLRLFIDALKAGNTDLAAKYFVLDKQQKWKEDLAKIKERGLLGDMVRDLENAKKYRSTTEDQIFFTAGNEAGEAVVSIDLVRIRNRWKIRGL